ncbi:hypothetical protein FHY29_002534 [Xanthomonas arboricola]|uniref:hypothetical protein n=1 Tax=Xanthomonas arboricola TaxID=56448 RepID=UPI000CEE8F94|nr:hypothetical protein [Xanthomonas arboricola]PPU52906.1 hypothetical protein XarbCFBP6827_16085 [Xanthomonas arboricola]
MEQPGLAGLFLCRAGSHLEVGSEAAEQRDAGIVASAKTIAWDDMRGYLEKRMAGEPAKRPTARKLAR